MTEMKPEALIEKLQAVIEANDGKTPHIFDDDEVETLQTVIQFMRRLQALGWFGRYVYLAIVGLVLLWSNWDALIQKIRGE